MNNKNLLQGVLILFLTFGFFVNAKAQSGAVQLGNGITVAIKTETVPPNDKNPLGNIYSSGTGYTGNIIHRVMMDTKNKIYFGYDLVAEKLDENGKFKVEIKQLSKSPAELFRQNADDYKDYTAKSLPNYPEAFVLDEGNSITLELLENLQTGTKISDIIKISSKGQNFNNYFSFSENAKDFTIEEINLRLDKPEISINGQKSIYGSSVSGNVVYFYLPGKGRFIFSFRPQPDFNFQKIGTVIDNKIFFEVNREKYEITNKSPVLGSGGKWNLWVMFDENFKPGSSHTSSSSEFGASGDVRSLFDFR